MANLRTIQFLRNAELYASLDAAKSALITKSASCLDGSPIAGRYTVQIGATTADTETRTILGIVANGTVSFFMNDKEIDNVLDGLDFGPIGGTDASVLTQIQQVDGKISGLTANVGTLKLTGYEKGSSSGAVEATDSVNVGIGKLEKRIDGEVAAINATINGLDANSVSGDSKVVIDVTQEDGQITASVANLTGVKLDGYQEAAATGDVATTDTLGEAIGKLQKTIHEMDKAADAVNGQVVTTVAEADGVVSETKANVKDLQLGGYSKTSDTGAISGTDTINVALSKIENQIGKNTVTAKDKSIVVETTGSTTEVGVNIKSGENVLTLDANNGLYTDIDLVKITTGLPETVKERYQLLATDDSQIGINIDIPKDSHIVSIDYSGSTQKLYYTYIDVSGETKTTEVDMGELVLEQEFASGVTVTDHIAHGVVDPTSESFLTVGANGFKVAGVADAISAAVNALDADKSGNSTHVTVNVVEENGIITYVNVEESNIANADDLATLSGKTVTAITSTNGSITADIDEAVGNKSYDLATDSSKIKLSGFTESSGTTDVAPANGDTINEALAKIYSAAKHHHITSGNDALSATVTTSGTTLTVNVDNSTAHQASDDTYASDNQNMIQIKDGGLYVSSSIDCGTF